MYGKQEMLKAIEGLPKDVCVEDALERLYLLYKIDKGIEQADAGELISQQEARRRTERTIEELRQFRKGNHLGGESIREMIEDGRR